MKGVPVEIAYTQCPESAAAPGLLHAIDAASKPDEGSCLSPGDLLLLGAEEQQPGVLSLLVELGSECAVHSKLPEVMFGHTIGGHKPLGLPPVRAARRANPMRSQHFARSECLHVCCTRVSRYRRGGHIARGAVNALLGRMISNAAKFHGQLLQQARFLSASTQFCVYSRPRTAA